MEKLHLAMHSILYINALLVMYVLILEVFVQFFTFYIILETWK